MLFKVNGDVPGHSSPELDDRLSVENLSIFETELSEAFLRRPDAEVASVVEPRQVVQGETRWRDDADLESIDYCNKCHWHY